MNRKTVVLPEMGEVSKLATEQANEAGNALELIYGIKITSNEGLVGAVAVLAEMKEKRAEVDEKLKQFVTPLKGVIKDIEKFFKPAIKALDDCEVELKAKVARFAEGQARLRSDLIAEAGECAAAGDELGAQVNLEDADTCVIEKVEGLSVRELWDGRVVDAKLIPREFLTPDVKALKALTRAKKCDPEIPGWEAFSKASVAITVGAVDR